MEVYVLMELKKSNAKHFCDILDRGRANDYNFVVMTLVGPSFDNLRKTASTEKSKQKFSLGCALSIAIKCVDAIEELHGIGYLHR
uniref:Protein kinase domain-containing protein n=1 Tax=Panagrolaimus superbus TaxID=310955 RepID=A0A914YSS8_9BILA